MAGGKQHAWQCEDVSDPLPGEPVEPEMDHRIGEFEIAVFDRQIGEPRLERIGERGEFANGALIPAAMAAKHDAGARRQKW